MKVVNSARRRSKIRHKVKVYRATPSIHTKTTPDTFFAKMAAGGAENYKVVLVGDLDVGKTTLFNRFKLGQFVDSEDERQTRQQAEHSKTWEYEGETFSVSRLQ